MPRFDYFVVLAGMRTGSNYLEANLNEYPGLSCHGELFNPHFVGHAQSRKAFGFSLADREKDPIGLIAAMRGKAEGLAGFRLFQDHDRRVIDAVLDDPRAAKIVLSRNVLDSYVSLRIAGRTGQWRLGDLRDARTAKVAFDREDFQAYRQQVRGFQEDILRRLQLTGQTAFFLDYEDVADAGVMNGLARFLGVEAERRQTSGKTKKQNPESLEEKVLNYTEMVAALAALDPFEVDRFPVFEPKRGPAVPNYVVAGAAPLMFLPVPAGPTGAVEDWLERAGGGPLRRGLDRKAARQWLRQAKGHRVFTVIRHPVPRLYEAFERYILGTGPGAYLEIREALRGVYGIALPDDPGDAAWDLAAHRKAFVDFAGFVGGNLMGQTSIRIDGSWASQAAVVQGMAQFVLPDAILREEELESALPALAAATGGEAAEWRPDAPAHRYPLERVYDREVEAQIRQIYQRDYLLFGFRPWSAG